MIFKEIKFPIEGQLREPLLILEWVIVLLFLEITVIFYAKIKNHKSKREPNQGEKGYFVMFLGYSIMWVFCIIGDYYAETSNARFFFLSIGFFIMIICGLIFLYRIEKTQIYFKRFLFSKIYVITIILIFISMLIGIDSPRILAFLSFYAIIYFFMILYLRRFASNPDIRSIQKNIKIMTMILSIGFSFLGIGFFLTTEYMLNIFGLIFRLVGDIVQLMGFLLVSVFLFKVPSLEEYEWRTKINKLFIIVKSGICIYYKDFKHDLFPFDEQTSSGVINTINNILKELTDKKGVSIIEKADKLFIIQPGKFITGILICDEDLNTFKILLNRFIEDIEEVYAKIFEDWNFNIKIFEPIEDMAKEIFLF